MRSLIHVLSSILLILFTFTTPSRSSNNVLYTYDSLMKGESLSYKDYALTVQHDCRLVLSGPNHAILWETKPAGEANNCDLNLQSDGELRFYMTEPKNPYLVHLWWRSGRTSERGNYALVLGYDGSLKIYGKSIWSSQKGIWDETHKDSEPRKLSKIPGTDSTLWSGDIAPAGTIIVKDKYKLELEATCNLTLTDTESNLVLWHTNTKDFRRDCFVKLESNGELKIMYMGGRATLWGNNAPSVRGQEYVLGIRPDGVLKVYGPVIWSLQRSIGEEADMR